VDEKYKKLCLNKEEKKRVKWMHVDNSIMVRTWQKGGEGRRYDYEYQYFITCSYIFTPDVSDFYDKENKIKGIHSNGPHIIRFWRSTSRLFSFSDLVSTDDIFSIRPRHAGMDLSVLRGWQNQWLSEGEKSISNQVSWGKKKVSISPNHAGFDYACILPLNPYNFRCIWHNTWL